MASQLELVQEAVKRGLPLPPEKQALYDEAVKRGLIQDARVSTASDVGWSALSSVPKAISGIAGVGADLSDALYGGIAYGVERLGGKTPEEAGAKKDEAIKSRQEMRQGMAETGLGAVTGITSGSAAIRKGIEDKFTGPLYDPKTVPGEYADTTGQFLTGALAFGAGGFIPRVLQGVVPGLVTETTGQVTREVAPEWENTARLVAGLGSSLGTNFLTTAKSANKVVTDALKGATREQVNKAIILMQESHQTGGVPLTLPEAVQYVTKGATTLDDIARVTENSREGGAIMRPFFAERPGQVKDAYVAQADNIDPIRRRPEVVGVSAQKAAKEFIERANADINKTTRPFYDAAHPVKLSPAQMQAIKSNPAYASIVAALRKDKYLGSHFKNVADDSIEMIDAVQKVMRGDAEGLAQSTSGVDRYAASVASSSRAKMVDEAKQMSPEYDRALREQARLREEYLNPIENGPIGSVARTSDVAEQTKAIFPAQPKSGSEVGVAEAMKALAKKDPQLAANVIGHHIDSVFDQATRKLTSGVNQAGGAKFSSVLAGSDQQMKNLEVAIRALPGGDSKWLGFKKLLDNLEATGSRPAKNSVTNTSAQVTNDLKVGGPAGTAFATAVSPSRWTRFMDTYQTWRLGKNTADLANIFTNPDAAKKVAELAVLKPGTNKYRATVSRIIELIGRPVVATGRADIIAPKFNSLPQQNGN